MRRGIICLIILVSTTCLPCLAGSLDKLAAEARREHTKETVVCGPSAKNGVEAFHIRVSKLFPDTSIRLLPGSYENTDGIAVHTPRVVIEGMGQQLVDCHIVLSGKGIVVRNLYAYQVTATSDCTIVDSVINTLTVGCNDGGKHAEITLVNVGVGRIFDAGGKQKKTVRMQDCSVVDHDFNTGALKLTGNSRFYLDSCLIYSKGYAFQATTGPLPAPQLFMRKCVVRGAEALAKVTDKQGKETPCKTIDELGQRLPGKLSGCKIELPRFKAMERGLVEKRLVVNPGNFALTQATSIGSGVNTGEDGWPVPGEDRGDEEENVAAGNDNAEHEAYFAAERTWLRGVNGGSVTIMPNTKVTKVGDLFYYRKRQYDKANPPLLPAKDMLKLRANDVTMAEKALTDLKEKYAMAQELYAQLETDIDSAEKMIKYYNQQAANGTNYDAAIGDLQRKLYKMRKERREAKNEIRRIKREIPKQVPLIKKQQQILDKIKKQL